MMCDRMGINVWEVIDAAATKPFGFMPFYPGPGLGGHCIPIDPFYLSWKSKQAGIEARFIELAGYINGQMPHFVVDKVQNALNDQTKPLRGSHVHILGVAYKRDIDDVRESPALDIIHLLNAAWREGHLLGSVCAVSVDRWDTTGSPGWCSRDRRLRGDHYRSCGLRLQISCAGRGTDRRHTERAEEHPVRQDRPSVDTTYFLRVALCPIRANPEGAVNVASSLQRDRGPSRPVDAMGKIVPDRNITLAIPSSLGLNRYFQRPR